MNFKFLKYLPILSILFFLGCKEEIKVHQNFRGLDKDAFSVQKAKKVILDSSNSYHNIIIPNVKERMAIDVSQIVDSISFVKLETNEECLIGKIKKIMFFEGSIYILDSNITKTLFKFSMDGKFIKKIGSYGKGPHEYLYPIFFDINKVSKEIYILDNKSSKIISYNLDGKHLDSRKIGLFSSEFIFNKLFYFSLTRSNNTFIPETNGFSVISTNSKSEILGKYISYDVKRQSNFRVHNYQSMLADGDNILYNQSMHNEIYEINDDNLRVKYHIDFGDRSLSKNFDFDTDYKGFAKKYDNGKSEKLYFTGTYLPIKDHLYFAITNSKGSIYHCIYSEKTKKVIIGNIVYDDTGMGFGNFMPRYKWNDYLIEYVHSYKILRNKNNLNFFNSRSEEVKEIINATKENDNPVLILHKLKKF